VKTGVFAKIGIFRKKYLKIGVFGKNWRFCKTGVFAKIGVFRKKLTLLQKKFKAEISAKIG
jgi:hypothetical protein